MKKKPSHTRRAASPSKALVVRRPAPVSRRREKPVRQELVLSDSAAALLAGPVKPPPPELVVAQTHLGEDIQLGALGTVELKLTAEEEAVLAEAVKDDDVAIKPTGQVYLSHPAYTRWFNRAFGRTGWSLVPASLPKRSERSVVQPYVLHVHGKPVAFAHGEQEYFEGNADQTYGDALESTVASALRRCAKRLGVGLELWDRTWINGFLQRHALKVFCRNRQGEVKPAWRKRSDPPFWNEVKEEHHEERRPPAASKPPASAPKTPPPVHHDGHGDEVISRPQLNRLWAIINKSGRVEADIKQWLADQGIEHTNQIKRKDYDRICNAIEHPGPLGGAKREPGQEG